MEEKSKWHIAAFASGTLFASVCGWAYGSLSPHASTLDYARVMGLAFLLAFGAGALVYISPAWWVALWWQLREAERLRLDAATFQRQRNELRFNFTAGTTAPKTVVVDADAEGWHTFFLLVTGLVVNQFDGHPHYKNGLDSVMNFQTWRAWTDPLVKDGILSPIAGGARTQWATGWSADRLLGKLEGGFTPPTPPGPPPTVQLDNR